MMIISANKITKSYGVDVILENVSFQVGAGDRVGIIGANGAGKTTLLKILSGELPCDSGDFFVSGDASVGYLKQSDSFRPDNTVLEEAEAAFAPVEEAEQKLPETHRTRYKSEIKGMLTHIAFGEGAYHKKIRTLSGGERTRLALACLLLQKPEILFLDEPTNHLDIGMLKWLEQYLKAYAGTILVVSHDRYFLDQTVNRIFEIEHHKLQSYEGSYRFFAEQKRLRREADLRKYQTQQKEVARQEEIIRRFKQHGTEKLAKRAQSREKRLEAMDRMERPEASPGKMRIHFKQNYKSGNDVLLGEGLAKSFGYGPNGKTLFENVNFDIKKNERICMVGPNGIGKTTLLRIITGDLEADQGYLKVGHNVDFGYYDQSQSRLRETNTILEEVQDAFRLYSETELRSILGRFLFRDDMVFLPVKALSGGEKARLSLLKLMLSGANVLILDEPTNHLDIESKEVFEDALLDFPGTIIAVSHDRYFLNKIPTKIFELGQEGILTFLGTYNYYAEKKQMIRSGRQYLDELPGKEAKGGKQPGGEQEQRQQKKALETAERRRKRRMDEAEAAIAGLEREVSKIESGLTLERNMTDPAKLTELSRALDLAKEELAEKYEEWLELQEV